MAGAAAGEDTVDLTIFLPQTLTNNRSSNNSNSDIIMAGSISPHSKVWGRLRGMAMIATVITTIGVSQMFLEAVVVVV